MFPSKEMRTKSPAPVAMEFAKSATPSFPCDRLTPIIPEPVITNSKTAVPNSSERINLRFLLTMNGLDFTF